MLDVLVALNKSKIVVVSVDVNQSINGLSFVYFYLFAEDTIRTDQMPATGDNSNLSTV